MSSKAPRVAHLMTRGASAPAWTALAAMIWLGLSNGAAAGQTQAKARPTAAGFSRPVVHESWSVDDGLPLNSIRDLVQTRDGYIWIATLDGVARFDGVRFTVFNSATTPNLPGNRFVALHESRDGSLWMRTERGRLVRYRHGRFTTFGPEQGLRAAVLHLYEDRQGVLRISTTDGVGRIQGDRFIPIRPESVGGWAQSVVARPDGSVWIATERPGLIRIDGEHSRPVGRSVGLDTVVTDTMALDPAGRLWLGASTGVWVEDGGFHQVMADGQPIPDVHAFAFPSRDGEVLAFAAQGVYRIEGDRARLLDSRGGAGTPVVDAEGNIWFSRGSGVYTEKGLAWDLTAAVGGDAAANAITALLVDREGSLWIGTFNAGLHRLKPSLFATFSEAEGLVQPDAATIDQDGSGMIWVGTRGGLSRIDAAGRIRKWTHFPGPSSDVFSLHADGSDHLWVGTGYSLLSCTLPAVTCRLVDATAVRQRHVYALYGDSRGRLWVGAGGAVAVRENGHWSALPGRPGTAPVRAFAETGDGALWMGTNGDGVIRWRDGRFTRIDQSAGLPSNLVRALHVDADGWLWVGTEGRGLARLDPRAWVDGARDTAKRIAHIGVQDGLYDGVIHQILEDDAGRFWMSTNRGIFWVRRAELLAFAEGRAARVHSTHYTERDGMRNREANGGSQPAGIRARDGRLWFPTQDGVVVVDPALVVDPREPPPAVIERVAAADTAWIPDGDPLSLDVNQRSLEIDYTAPTFLEPGNVRFRYRLDPYDADWVDAGRRRTAFYTRLPPGHYRFRVSASTYGDVWSEAGAPLTLDLAPRFRETGAAKLLLLLSLGLLVLAGFQWRVRSLRLREVELTRTVDERTTALRRKERQLEAQNAQLAHQATRLAELDEAKSRLFANLSHEFRTPLTLILGPLRSVLDGRHGALPPSVRTQGELMLKNGQRLLRLINQVLDLSKLEAGQLSLERRPCDLVDFARGITLAFAPLAERRDVALRFQSNLATLTLDLDAEQLEKVLLNLLSNALKFTPAGGAVDVSVGMDGARAAVVVRDTGVGIAPEELPRIFERFYQADNSTTRRYEGTGIGLPLARELVELHGGDIHVDSAPGVGSTFTVRLPLGEALRTPEGHAAADAQGLPVAAAAAVPGTPPVGIAPPPTAVPDVEAVAASRPAPTLDAGPGLDETSPRRDDPGEPDADRTTVLLVDDNADVRAYVRSVLAPSYRILEAADGRAGLERAQADLPDLIVADVMMPELDGLALGRALKDDPMTDAIPVVLLTARAATEDRIAGLETGADAYLVKPFEPGVLEALVANLLTQRQRLRERFRHGEVMPPTPAPLAPSELERRLRPIVEARLLEDDFGPDALAAAAGLSYHQLYYALRKELDITPSRFIRGVRVERAAELLRQGAGSVTEIAYSVGFEALSHFSRSFRERFDASPSEYLAARAPRSSD